MSTTNGPTPDNAMILTPRQERLLAMRDEMAPGAKPAAIVPRNFVEAQEMCRALARSGLVPRAYVDHPEDLIVTIMSGAEIGLPPMASIRLYHLMDGIPRLSAEGIRAVVIVSPECEYFECASCDGTQATWIGKRPGRPEKSVTWTVDRAKKAGLWDRKNRDGSPGNWQKYTEEMLNARASMQLARMIWPNVIAGMLSREEAHDGDFIDAQFTETKAQAFVAPPVQIANPREVPVIIGAPTPVTVATQGPPPGVPQADAKPPRQRADRRDAALQSMAKPADPTPPPPASAGPSGSAALSGISQSSSSASSAPASQPSKLDAAVQAVRDKEPEPQVIKDMWGQPIGYADPTSPSSSTGPTPSGESAAASTAAKTSGAAPDAGGEGFGSDDPVDTQPPQPTMADFHAWLAGCKTQRDLAAGLARWRAWSKHKCDVEGDKAFHKTGPATIAMQDAYSKRKSEVPA